MKKVLVMISAALAVVGAITVAKAEEIGDAERGAKAFRACKACHRVGQGATNRIGPQLNGLFGRAAGSVDGFRYSDSMERMNHDGLIWTLETLNAFIENPKALVSRTKMNFSGVRDAQKRADILAYLRLYSDDPADIPEAEPTAISELPSGIMALVGDPEYGEYLAGECATCHQADGSDQGIPAISGWPVDDFVIALHAYKEQIRPHPVMQMMAGRLSNEEIAALAAYFKDQ